MDEHVFQTRAEQLRLSARAEVADEVRAIRERTHARMSALRANNQLELAAARGRSMRKSKVPVVLLTLAGLGATVAAGILYSTPQLEPTEASVHPTWSGDFSAGVVLTGAVAERQIAKADTAHSKFTKLPKPQPQGEGRSRAPCTGDAFDPLDDCLR